MRLLIGHPLLYVVCAAVAAEILGCSWERGSHQGSLGSPKDRVNAVQFSTDGRRLYCACLDRALCVVETATGRDAVCGAGSGDEGGRRVVVRAGVL